MLRIFVCSFLVGLSYFPVLSQGQKKDSIKINIPSLKIIQSIRPSFFEFEYSGVMDYPLVSQSDELGDSEAEVRNNRRLRFKLNLPLVLKEDLRLALGLSYIHEQFTFDDIQQVNYPLYERLEDKSLRSIGMRFYLKKDLSDNRFFKSRFGVDLNGDKITAVGFTRFFKGNISFVYGKQKNELTEIGYGLYAGYDFGIPSILPVFNYNRILSEHWLMELLLPKSIKFTHTPSERIQISGQLEVTGASYHMEEEVLEGYSQLELRQSELRFMISANREIYDFIWARVGIGALRNINFFVSEPLKRRKDAIITAQPFSAYTVEFSIYLVPPRKMFNKAIGL